MKRLICLIFGCRNREIFKGLYQYIDEKNNKPFKVALEGYGVIYECARCKRQSVKRIYGKERKLK